MGVRALDVVIVSLSSLTVFLLPLIALLISHDAIVGEMERGTLLLLLSYPVARWQVLLGKFWSSGHPGLRDAPRLRRRRRRARRDRNGYRCRELDSFRLIDRLLGPPRSTFVAIGYVVSALVRDRGTAGGIAVGIWLVFVLIYDMALLGSSSSTRARPFPVGS